MNALYVDYTHVVLYLCVYFATDFFLDWLGREAAKQDDSEEFSTSVWCRGSNHTDRMCVFRNLCYRGDTGDFLFFHGAKSTLLGIPENRYEAPLVDLSSVSDHGALYFAFVDLPSRSRSSFRTTRIESTTLITSRLNPDNIMHVFHDDLIPIFATARELCSCDTESEIRDFTSNLTVFFADGRQKGRYWHLYRTLLTKPPLLATSLTASRVYCFDKAVVGLQKGSTWYQYGFKTPQGPIFEHLSRAGTEVARFVRFFRGSLRVPPVSTRTDVAVLLLRAQNRRILNVDALSKSIEERTGLRVTTADLSRDSAADVIRLLSGATLLVAVHGSALVLSAFLPAGSAVVELFPYAVNPDRYTPYKTLARLRGVDLSYGSWRNANASNTVAHPDREPRLGGIAHLPPQERRRILEGEEVPPHTCCTDPWWLFRIYQDTVVDDSVFPVVDAAVGRARGFVPGVPGTNLLPGFVRDVDCVLEDAEERRNVRVRWRKPWNLDHMSRGDCRYELWLQTETETKAVVTPRCEYATQTANGAVRVWVRAVCGDDVGGFGAFPAECTAD